MMTESDRHPDWEDRKGPLLSGADTPSSPELDVARHRLDGLLRMGGLLGIAQLREEMPGRLDDREQAVLLHVAEERRRPLAFSHWKAVSHGRGSSRSRIETEQRALVRLVAWLSPTRAATRDSRECLWRDTG